MLGFDVCHEITNAMEVGVAFATRGITNWAAHHIHLAPTIVLTVVDEPLNAALELLCTLGVAPSLVKTGQLSQLGWGVAITGVVADGPARIAADALVVVLVMHSRAKMLMHASNQLITRGVRR